jgi:hypothetical protein
MRKTFCEFPHQTERAWSTAAFSGVPSQFAYMTPAQGLVLSDDFDQDGKLFAD